MASSRRTVKARQAAMDSRLQAVTVSRLLAVMVSSNTERLRAVSRATTARRLVLLARALTLEAKVTALLLSHHVTRPIRHDV
jgi:4-hydroxy-3-methylbut-2-enyl diphosphate reductase IspH